MVSNPDAAPKAPPLTPITADVVVVPRATLTAALQSVRGVAMGMSVAPQCHVPSAQILSSLKPLEPILCGCDPVPEAHVLAQRLVAGWAKLVGGDRNALRDILGGGIAP